LTKKKYGADETRINKIPDSSDLIFAFSTPGLRLTRYAVKNAVERIKCNGMIQKY